MFIHLTVKNKGIFNMRCEKASVQNTWSLLSPRGYIPNVMSKGSNV